MTFKTAVPEKTKGTYQVCLTSEATGFDIFVQQNKELKLLRSHKTKNETSKICVSSQTKYIMIYILGYTLGFHCWSNCSTFPCS